MTNLATASGPTLARLGLGGGCHWCTEGVFVSLRGVARVEQGWISAPPPHDAFSEAVIVHYDPAVVAADDLVAVHLETHAATQQHGLRHRYRSAVYYFDPADAAPLRAVLDELAADYAEPLVTQLLPFAAFRPSLPEHLDYYRTDPERPFCQRYITPKLDALRRNRSELLSGEAVDRLGWGDGVP